MKSIILITTMLLTFGAANAQIGEVKVAGNQLNIYDVNGIRMAGSISFYTSDELVGYNAEYIVVKQGNQAVIYNAKGVSNNRYVPLCDGCKVKNVTPSAILVKDGNGMTRYYDFEGNNTGKYTTD